MVDIVSCGGIAHAVGLKRLWSARMHLKSKQAPGRNLQVQCQGPGTDALPVCGDTLSPRYKEPKCAKHAPGQFDSFDVPILFSPMRPPPGFPNDTLLRFQKSQSRIFVFALPQATQKPLKPPEPLALVWAPAIKALSALQSHTQIEAAPPYHILGHVWAAIWVVGRCVKS